MIDFVSTVAGAFVGSGAALGANIAAKRYEAQGAARVAHNDLLRESALKMSTVATQVGEGDGSKHADVRAAYHEILLIAQRREVQAAARRIVRTSYQIREEQAGRPRRPAPNGFEKHPAAEMRAEIRAFMVAVRLEMGIKEPLIEEPTD